MKTVLDLLNLCGDLIHYQVTIDPDRYGTDEYKIYEYHIPSLVIMSLSFNLEDRDKYLAKTQIEAMKFLVGAFSYFKEHHGNVNMLDMPDVISEAYEAASELS